MRYLPFLFLATMLLSPPLSWAVTDIQKSKGAEHSPEFVAGEILLKVAPGASARAVASGVNGKIQKGIGDGTIVLVDVGRGQVGNALLELKGRPGVVFAEPNWLRRLHLPNDPGASLKWDLHNDGSLADGSDRATADADVDWLEAYNFLGTGFGGTATIAVLDTGIDTGHPDLNDKIVTGYDYLDGDGNPTDTYGHGTHVAGIALGETGNNIGTAGIAYGNAITVMPLRVCSSSGCPTSAVANAIYHAANNGANVINLSLGGRFASSAEQQAINYAWSRGLVIVASSGNDGAGKVSYPAAFSNAMATGSTNWHDELAPYSNKGSALDIVAPGGDMSRYHDPGGIYSTMPTYDVYLTTRYSYSKNYDQLQGTSMSAPQVAGLAALIFAANPSLSNGEVRAIIENTADDFGKSGWDRDFGWGRINAYRALLEATGSGTPIDSPPNVTLTAPQHGSIVSGTIDVTANASDDDAVSSVEFFIDNSFLGLDSDGSDGWSVGWDTTTAVEGNYSLTVIARDTAGQSASDSIDITVDNLPDADVTVLSLTPPEIQSGVATPVSISGTGFMAQPTIRLENGSGPTPVVSAIEFVDSGTINVSILAKSGGPPRERLWDVRVTNVDGSSGVLLDGLRVLP